MLATGLAVLLGAAAPALGEAGPKLRLERADVSRYPILQLYLSYVEADGRVVTGKGNEDFKLLFDSAEQGTASSVKVIEQTGEPVYLVLVAQVSSTMGEVFTEEKQGLATLARAAGSLKGSRVALLTYAQEVHRVAELGKPGDIEAKLAAVQIDADATSSNLVSAVRTAIDQLNAKGVPDDARKLIVVFSDGIDSSATERKSFAELGRRALQSGIVIDVISYNPFDPTKLKLLAEMAKQSNGGDRPCKTAQDVGAQFNNTADELRKQYVVLFQSAIAGDSKEHTIQVADERGSKPVYSNNVTKICQPHVQEEAAVPFWKKWWFWVLCGGALLALVLVWLVVRARRAAVAPEPVLEAPAPMLSEAPLRTMALDLGASGRGPTIGWIVGTTGNYVDKTFKLKTPRTLIGTAPDADVVIDDKFMSAKHCEVRYDGNTFRIYDLGSTNGVVLNDRPVSEHDLVDGDTLRLGRTEFKFKSIN